MGNFLSMLGETYDRSVTHQLRELDDAVELDFNSEANTAKRARITANAQSDVASQLIMSRPVQSNNQLRLEMQADIGARSRAVLPLIVKKHTGSAQGVAYIKKPEQLRVAMREAKGKRTAVLSTPAFGRPAASFASLPVVSMLGMTNANNRVSCNGLNPTERRARRMRYDEDMARRLDRSFAIGPNDPINVDDDEPHQWPPPLTPGAW
jgi:hypothetical protein